jgi:hypothetical protein
MSEFLREKQRGCEVNKQQDRKQESHYSDEVHDLPQLLTGLDVEKGHGKKDCGEKEHYEILHCEVPQFRTAHSRAGCGNSKIDFARRSVVFAEGKSKGSIKT